MKVLVADHFTRSVSTMALEREEGVTRSGTDDSEATSNFFQLSAMDGRKTPRNQRCSLARATAYLSIEVVCTLLLHA